MSYQVLLVEDDKIISDLIKMGLASLGCGVEQAENGQIGQELLAVNDYDMVIMDLYLPVLDGIKLLKWLREEKASKVPVMILSAANVTMEEARQYGADDLMTKPIDFHELLVHFKQLLITSASQTTG